MEVHSIASMAWGVLVDFNTGHTPLFRIDGEFRGRLAAVPQLHQRLDHGGIHLVHRFR